MQWLFPRYGNLVWFICHAAATTATVNNTTTATMGNFSAGTNSFYCPLICSLCHSVPATRTPCGTNPCYRPQRSCGKVMFLHLSVILFTGGRAWHARPPPIWSMSGRYGPTGMHPCTHYLFPLPFSSNQCILRVLHLLSMSNNVYAQKTQEFPVCCIEQLTCPSPSCTLLFMFFIPKLRSVYVWFVMHVTITYKLLSMWFTYPPLCTFDPITCIMSLFHWMKS